MDAMIKNNSAKNIDELISYLEIKAANHKHYKHYSSMKNAENILNNIIKQYALKT